MEPGVIIVIIISALFPLLMLIEDRAFSEGCAGCLGTVLFFAFIVLWIATGFWPALAYVALPAIVVYIIMFLFVSIRSSGSNSSGNNVSTRTSSIPNYSNWDSIYNSLERDNSSNNAHITKYGAIDAFRRDYNKTKRAFSEESRLRKVSDYEKNYLLGFFSEFQRYIDMDLVELDDRGWGEFYLYYRDNGNTIMSYHRWPIRKYPEYDMIMYKGEIRRQSGSWLRFGLSNEHNQQYWRTYDSSDNSIAGFDPLNGQVEG